MPPSSMPWVKLFTDFLDDRKIGRLADSAQLLFVKLLLIAGECDAEGYLIDSAGPMGFSDIAWRLRADKTEIANQMAELNHAGLVDQVEVEEGVEAFLITNFSKRQGRSQSEKREQWRKAQQKKRASNDTDEDHKPEPPAKIEESNDSHTSVINDNPMTPLSREEEEERRESGAEAPPPPENPPEQARAASNQDKVRKTLEVHFLKKTGLPAPKTRNEKEKRAAGSLWYGPLREIAELAGWDGDAGCQLIDEALRDLKDLTITDPNSILKTARACYARHKPGVNGSTPAVVWS